MNGVSGLGYSPPEVIEYGHIWVLWGSYYNIPEAILYLLKGDYSPFEAFKQVFLQLKQVKLKFRDDVPLISLLE